VTALDPADDRSEPTAAHHVEPTKQFERDREGNEIPRLPSRRQAFLRRTPYSRGGFLRLTDAAHQR